MNVGDYVRTKDGSIDKIKYIDNENNTFLENYNKENNIFGANSIIKKSSPQIIDLIEVGDYVNGHKVIEVDLDDIDDYGNTFRYIKTEHDYSLNYWVKENEIETIITKEQFDAMQYRVEE